MVRLARNYKNGFLSTSVIAQEENIPKNFRADSAGIKESQACKQQAGDRRWLLSSKVSGRSFPCRFIPYF